MANNAVATAPDEKAMDADAASYGKSKSIIGESPKEYAPGAYPPKSLKASQYIDEPSTIDLRHRQIVDNNAEGNDPRNYGSEYSARDELPDGRIMSYPTIYEGKVHDRKEAFKYAQETKQHLGIYKKDVPDKVLDEAENYAHSRPITVNGKPLNGDEWARLKGLDPEEIAMDEDAKNYPLQKEESKPSGGMSMQQYLMGEAGGHQPKKEPEPKQGPGKNNWQLMAQFFEEQNKNPPIQALNALEGSAIKGAGRALTLPVDAALELTGHQPTPNPMEQDPQLNKDIAAHPIVAGIGNFGGAGAAMLTDPLYEVGAIGNLAMKGLGKTIPAIGKIAEIEKLAQAAKVAGIPSKVIDETLKVPAIYKIAKAALGSIPISAEMAINQQAMDNKGKIDWTKAAQLAATYVAANAGISGAAELAGAAGKKLVTAIAQAMEKGEQTAPLNKPASFQQAPSGQPGGLVADILNQLGQASKRVTVGNKVLEFADPTDAALFNANKAIASKEGRKAWKTLQDAGMSNDQIDKQAKLVRQGAQLLAKEDSSPSISIEAGKAQKRAQAEEANKLAQKEAKTQEKQNKQINSAQDKRAKELAKEAEKQKKTEQDAFAKEVDEREKAIAKAEAEAEKYKKSGQKQEEAKARKQLNEQKALLDKANAAWEKAGKPKAGTELNKLSTEANFANREENWDYRHEAIPAFNKASVPQADRRKFTNALTAIVSAGKKRLAEETDYEASQDLFRESMGMGVKQGKAVSQAERERLRTTTPNLELQQGDPHFNILPQTRPEVSVETQQYANTLRKYMTSGKDYRIQIARYMMQRKAAWEAAEAAYRDAVATKGDIVRKYMQPGTQLDHADANIWYREGNINVVPGTTKASKEAHAVYKSGLQNAMNKPETSTTFKSPVETQGTYIKKQVTELKNTAAMEGNKTEAGKLNAILDTLKTPIPDSQIAYGAIIPPNVLRTAAKAATILTRTFGHVIPSKRTLFSLSSTINNLDVYNDTVPELADYLRGKMAAVQRQSMGVEFPKTPEQNDAYMEGLRSFSDDTIDEALDKGEGKFAQLPESTRNFLMYLRQQRREIISVLKGIKGHFYGEGENYVPPTNPFDPGRMQLHHVISSDIDTLSGTSGATNRLSADMARNLYVSQLTGKISPHVAHITSALQNNTSYDPIWWLRIGQGMREGPELKQAAEAFNNQGPLRSLINEREINPQHEVLNKVMQTIDNSWLGNARDAIDKAVPMSAEQKQGMINLLTGATTEQAKTTVTRMGAIARAAQKEGMTPGQGAKLLLDDASSTTPNITALRMHYSIAEDMREIIGNNAPGLRTTTILDHVPIFKILAPYNFQRNVNTRLWLSYIGDMGEALRQGDNIEASKAFSKALLHTGIATTYLGAKALPVEMLAATNFVNPHLAQAVNTQLNQWGIVSHASNLNMGHLQMSLNPTATTNLGFVRELVDSFDNLHNAAFGTTPPKDEEHATQRYEKLATSAAFLLALAGHTEFTKLLGTQAAIQYFRAAERIKEGKKDVYYRAQPFGIIGGGYIVGKEKDVLTNPKDEIIQALTGGETWQEFVKDTQFNANEGARLNMQYFHNKEYNSIIKQQGVDAMKEVLGAEDAKLFGFKKKPIREMNWQDIWNEYNASPINQAKDVLQKQPPPETGALTQG